MKIKIKGYVLEPCTTAAMRYDLYEEIVSINKKTGEPYDNQSAIGYGMALDRCIETIIFEEVNKDKSDTDLKGYLDAYKAMVEEIKQLVTV